MVGIAGSRVSLAMMSFVLAVSVGFVGVPEALGAEDDPIIESIAFDIDGFQDLLLVEETDRLFVTGGKDADTVLVVDLDGNEISRTTGLDGVRQMAYDPTRDLVWVATADDPGVIGFDGATGTKETELMLPAAMCPSAVALAGGADGNPGNELLVVASECNGQLVVVDLGDESWTVFSGEDYYSGVIEVASSPPPEQSSRVVILTDDSLNVVNVQDNPPNLIKSVAVTATSLATSSAGSRRVALGSASGVEIRTYPGLDLTDSFSLGEANVALDWTTQPAVVAVDNVEVLGLKPSAAGPFWTFPVAPAVPFENGIQSHSDGRLYIVAELPPPPDGGAVAVAVAVAVVSASSCLKRGRIPQTSRVPSARWLRWLPATSPRHWKCGCSTTHMSWWRSTRFPTARGPTASAPSSRGIITWSSGP